METPPFPNKKYQVIYADPPWDVQKIKRKSRPNQIEFDYPTMKLEDIKSLPIQSISEKDCVLFLWTTHAYLPKAFEVMEAWGFKYQRTITWDKQNGMCLFGFHHRTEFLLFGYKGKIEMYPSRKAFPTMVQAKSPYHSSKPQIFRTLIEPFGDGRIELFARQAFQGWDVWGNEIANAPTQTLLTQSLDSERLTRGFQASEEAQIPAGTSESPIPVMPKDVNE